MSEKYYTEEEKEQQRIEWEHACQREKANKLKKKKLDSFKPKKFKRKRGLKRGMWRRKEKQ